MATVLRSVLADVSWIGHVPKVYCMAISCAVLVFSCVTGGIIASVYTDLVQGIIMIVVDFLVLFTAVTIFADGFVGMSWAILTDDAEAMSPWGTLGMIGCLSWYFIFALGAYGQPHVITKLMMTRRVRDARHMLPIMRRLSSFSTIPISSWQEQFSRACWRRSCRHPTAF